MGNKSSSKVETTPPVTETTPVTTPVDNTSTPPPAPTPPINIVKIIDTIYEFLKKGDPQILVNYVMSNPQLIPFIQKIANGNFDDIQGTILEGLSSQIGNIAKLPEILKLMPKASFGRRKRKSKSKSKSKRRHRRKSRRSRRRRRHRSGRRRSRR